MRCSTRRHMPRCWLPGDGAAPQRARGIVRVFLSISFPGNYRNREHVEAVIAAIESASCSVFCFVRDAEDWGQKRFEPEDMMRRTFAQIDESHFLIADVADWPIGVGVEAGYARAKGIPVICICPTTKRVASTVAGLAAHTIAYEDYGDLAKKLVGVVVQ